MTWWPGWDSIEGSGGWSHFWFWFGIICLFALGASEIVSHVYGLRKDELVEVSTKTADAQREKDQKAADTRHTTEIGGLRQTLTEADAKVAELQRQQIPRSISKEQKDMFVAALSPFKGQRVKISVTANDPEAYALARDFVDVLRDAEWDGATNLTVILTRPPTAGVRIQFNEAEANAERIPASAGALAKVLIDGGFAKANELFISPQIEVGVVDLHIGHKPTTASAK